MTVVKVFLVMLVASVGLNADPHHGKQKHGTRIPGVVNAATYPGRHPVKAVKPFYKAGKRLLW